MYLFLDWLDGQSVEEERLSVSPGVIRKLLGLIVGGAGDQDLISSLVEILLLVLLLAVIGVGGILTLRKAVRGMCAKLGSKKQVSTLVLSSK